MHAVRLLLKMLDREWTGGLIRRRPVSGGEKEYLDYAFKKPKKMLSYMFVTSAVSF
jgi:hypothetical protein